MGQFKAFRGWDVYQKLPRKVLKVLDGHALAIASLKNGVGINHERFGEYSYCAGDANFPSIRQTVNEILSGTHYTQR